MTSTRTIIIIIPMIYMYILFRIERSWLREEYREPAALEQFKEDKRLSNEGKVLQGLQRRIQNLPDELSELDKQWIRKLYQSKYNLRGI